VYFIGFHREKDIHKLLLLLWIQENTLFFFFTICNSRSIIRLDKCFLPETILRGLLFSLWSLVILFLCRLHVELNGKLEQFGMTQGGKKLVLVELVGSIDVGSVS
jgi:hypothetical protein